MSRHTPLDLSEHLPYLINRVGSALVARFSADALGGAHLSVAAWRVLAVLSSNGGLRQTDLAEMTSIDSSTLSRLITRLVHDDLVRRTRSKTDSREVAVELTRNAQALLRETRSGRARGCRTQRRIASRRGIWPRSSACCGRCTAI